MRARHFRRKVDVEQFLDQLRAERGVPAPTAVEAVATTRRVRAEPRRTEAKGRRDDATHRSYGPTFWVALTIALVPFVVSALTVLVAGRGYHSYSDNALTELSVRDIGRHFVEVGVFNRLGWHHLGPVFFYALAPVYRVLGSRSFALLIGALLVNAATIVGIALVARRRAGDGFAIAALAGSIVIAHSFGPSFLRDPWTPNIVVLALVLFVFLAWSLAEADTSVLPWTVLVASWIVQAHLAPMPPVAATLVAGVAIGARRIRSTYLRDSHAPVVASLRRRVLMAGGVLIVVWLPPLVDVVTHSGGNMRAVIKYFLNSPGGTLAEGYRVVANQLKVPPPWLGRNPIRIDLVLHAVEPHGVTPWLGIVLVVGIIVAWRTRQSRALRFALIIAIALVSEIFAVSRIAPTRAYGGIQRSPFFWDVYYIPGTAMLAALATAYAVWGALERRTSWPWLRPTATVLLVATLAVPASMLAVSSADVGRVPNSDGSDAIAAVAPGTLRSLRDTRGPVLVQTTSPDLLVSATAYHDVAAMVVLLDQHGVHAVVGPSLRLYFPSTSIQATNSFSAVVTIVALADVFRYRPTRRERLAGVGGRFATGFQRLVVHGPAIAVFVAPGSAAGHLALPPGQRKRGLLPY